MGHESYRRNGWYPGEVLGTALAYFACASLALVLTRFDGGIAVVWLAGSVLFARLRSRRADAGRRWRSSARRWPSVPRNCSGSGG